MDCLGGYNRSNLLNDGSEDPVDEKASTNVVEDKIHENDDFEFGFMPRNPVFHGLVTTFTLWCFEKTRVSLFELCWKTVCKVAY